MITPWLTAALSLAAATAASDAPSSRPAPAVRADLLRSPAWLASRLSDPAVVVVHVGRTRANYDRAHIPGARFLPWSDIAQDRDGLLNELPPLGELTTTVRRLGIDQRHRVVLYDDADGIPAARAFLVFDYLGLGERSGILDGHWARWSAEGRPVSSEAPRVTPSAWEPQAIRHDAIIGLEEMRKLVAAKAGRADAAQPILDARPYGEYCGTVKVDGLTRAGSIPGAVSLSWTRNYVRPETPTFRPAEELRKIYAGAGVRAGEPVIVHCRTGASACVDYFAARYLGYQPRLYDGSFSQWSSLPDTIVRQHPHSQPAK
jgi:thiosulfate/3-mercaptopyruvate sulfurtransferase